MSFLDHPGRWRLGGYLLLGALVLITAFATASFGATIQAGPGWDGLEDDQMLVVTSPRPGQQGESLVHSVDPLNGETRLELWGLPTHASVAFSDDSLYVVSPGNDGNEEVPDSSIIRFDAGNLTERAARHDLPSPLGTTDGRTDQALWLVQVEGDELLVYAHFVRAFDARAGTNRNEFAVALLSGTTLETLDFLDPLGCADGRVVNLSAGQFEIWCPAEDITHQVVITAGEFSVVGKVKAPEAPASPNELQQGIPRPPLGIERVLNTEYPTQITLTAIEGRLLATPIDGALPFTFDNTSRTFAISERSGQAVIVGDAESMTFVTGQLDAPVDHFVVQIAFKS